MITVQKQLEGIKNIHQLNKETNHWGFVETPYGRMFLGGHDDGIALRYFHGYVYEPVSMLIWTRLCAAATLAIDVGAHTGIYTLAAYAAGARKVISIEPYFLNAARLILNLHANKRPMHSVAICAASAKDGIGQLHASTYGTEYYCTTAGNLQSGKLNRSYVVQLNRLDSLTTHHVSVMKIDAEYHTAAVLDGATDILKTTPDLILESFEKGLTERLAPLGYRFWLIDERDGLHPATALEPQEMDEFRRNYFASVREAPADLLA